MKTRRLIWKLYPSYLLVVFACLFVLGWYFLQSFNQFQIKQARKELEAAAAIARTSLQAETNTLSKSMAKAICRSYGKASGYRFTIVTHRGEVLGDSEESPDAMENHADRPEIKRALKGEVGWHRRLSRTLRTSMLYVAVPVFDNGNIIGVVRSSLPLLELETALHRMKGRLFWFAIMLAVLASLATVLATRVITRPLGMISRQSVAVGSGKSFGKLPPSKIMEVDALSKSINRMAEQLQDRIDKVESQRDEQNVLFACIAEGVLALDNQERVIRINAAAQSLLGIKTDNLRSKTVSELVRQPELLEIVKKTLSSEEIVEDSIMMNERNTYIQIHGSRLVGTDGEMIGALLVLNDVTRLRKLEIMRKDFVANVSHELKTPITSIRGFLDTLTDTRVENEADRERFMHIINQQVIRLQAIVEDLLTFANLEHEIDKKDIELQERPIHPILSGSIRLCADKAKSKNIAIHLNAKHDLKAVMNPQLLERAVVNLIDNAIKYSEKETHIEVSAEKKGDEVAIRVSDEGMGISTTHHSRIFERFYCVDKSRSRELGGTGLGLAIVKHVAIAHNGRVELESKRGAGSTFSVYIPAA